MLMFFPSDVNSRRCHIARIFCRMLCLPGLDLSLSLVEKKSFVIIIKMFLIKTLSHEQLKFNVFILKPKLEQLHLQEKKNYLFDVTCIPSIFIV